jgi:serine/threonine-protein kinase
MYWRQLRGRIAESQAEFRQALEVAERLARENPEVVAYQESRAGILHAYAVLQAGRADFPGAATTIEQAVGIMDRLAGNHPEVTKYQLGLARNLGLLGQFASSREEALKRSIAILERLASDHPQDMNIAEALGNRYFSMADRQRDSQSAVEWWGRAIQLFRSIARRDAHNISTGRTQLWNALAMRAETSLHLGRYAEALGDLVEVRELTKGIKAGELFRAFHALTKARLGDLSALALLGDQVRNTLKVGTGREGGFVYGYWMAYCDAAYLHAALATLALRDQGQPPDERQRLADQDLDRALELLDKSRATGEFRRKSRRDEIRREPFFDPLRSHPRFQLLMMDLAFPDSPFGAEGGSP